MTTISDLSQIYEAKPEARLPRHASGVRHTRIRNWRREIFENWIGPLSIAMILAICFQIGMFTQTDGRFFDTVTLNQPGTRPGVVVIERDAGFEALGDQRFTAIEDALALQGIERIGYLGADRGAVRSAKVPVVVGLDAKPLPENRSWELQLPQGGVGEASATARSLPGSQYGINRSQTASLTGRDGPIEVFDAALAAVSPDTREEFLIAMPAQQSIPILKASQLVEQQLPPGELSGMVAMVVQPEALEPSLNTPISPDRRATSEAIFRAYAVNALRSERIIVSPQPWLVWTLLLAIGVMLALVYRKTDPKRVAIIIPFSFTILAAGSGWAAIVFGGMVLPITALIAAPWLVTFQRVLQRETSQDRRLERTASHAVQTSFNRTALREGARLPESLGSTAKFAGVERSLIVELQSNGKLAMIAAHNASMDDIAISPRRLNAILRTVKETFSVRDADDIVPSWGEGARVGWVGAGKQQLFWLHTRPQTATPVKAAHLLQALVSSFREVFRWRTDLNARSAQEDRLMPVDDKVASAIALVANESEQVRRGFDTIDTAIVIFHLIGTPLHANSTMRELYEEAGLDVFDSSLADVLLALSDLQKPQVDALIEDILLNGSEMRMPMRDLGTSQRMLRVAAPVSGTHGNDRILVLEAIDMRDVNRIAELRKAVGKFVDLQLRNDFEAIMLGSQLAGDERLGIDQIRSVVGEIAKTARRATGRLDDVAHLIRNESNDMTEAWYPIDAKAVVVDAIARVSSFADELGVAIEADHPGLGGFTIAEPVALGDMLVAMLRVVIADTPQGGAVKLKLEELKGRTHIRISGGFGIGFGRLLWLISNHEDGAVGEYRVIGEIMTKVTSWSASVSYWGSEANGFGFNIDLQGVG